MAYRNDHDARDARAAVLRVEITDLERKLAEHEAAHKAIGEIRRTTRFSGLREVVRPWALFVLVLAAGAGFYVGSNLRVERKIILDTCPPGTPGTLELR